MLRIEPGQDFFDPRVTDIILDVEGQNVIVEINTDEPYDAATPSNIIRRCGYRRKPGHDGEWLMIKPSGAPRLHSEQSVLKKAAFDEIKMGYVPCFRHP